MKTVPSELRNENRFTIPLKPSNPLAIYPTLMNTKLLYAILAVFLGLAEVNNISIMG